MSLITMDNSFEDEPSRSEWIDLGEISAKKDNANAQFLCGILCMRRIYNEYYYKLQDISTKKEYLVLKDVKEKNYDAYIIKEGEIYRLNVPRW